MRYRPTRISRRVAGGRDRPVGVTDKPKNWSPMQLSVVPGGDLITLWWIVTSGTAEATEQRSIRPNSSIPREILQPVT